MEVVLYEFWKMEMHGRANWTEFIELTIQKKKYQEEEKTCELWVKLVKLAESKKKKEDLCYIWFGLDWCNLLITSPGVDWPGSWEALRLENSPGLLNLFLC